MLERIVCGGQTGADQAGGRAARACRSAIGGGRPRGFLTEGGPRPDGADLYGAHELPMGGLPRGPSPTRGTAMPRAGAAPSARRALAPRSRRATR